MYARSLLDYERLSPADQLRIEEISAEFEEVLRTGESPSLERFVERGTMACRRVLFAELLALELAYRCTADGPPHAAAYLARFPEWTVIVRRVYEEPDLADLWSGREALPSGNGGAAQFGRQELPRLRGYDVLEKLGQGGMGVVYKARHVQLKRLVAVKMLLHGDFASEHQMARFLVEGEALARLKHPHIVQVFEAGEQDGRPFLALEYVGGGTLRERLYQGPFQAEEAAELTEQLARAIHHAHLQGIVHRDLKPGNVLLQEADDSDGVRERAPTPAIPLKDSSLRPVTRSPKITDFGLARYVEGVSGLSATGQIMGTPTSMAPEQARGEVHCGPAVDIYALGGILYELLTGRVPFHGKSGVEILQKVKEEEPTPLSHWQSTVPPDLETICLKCLRKEPKDRYESAWALAEDLGRWRRGEPITARPVGRLERFVKWTRRRPAAAGLAAVSALFFVAVLAIPSVAALQLQQERERTRTAERQHRQDLIRAVQNARPDSLPWIIETLRAARGEAVPLLRQQLAMAPDDDHRRRSAIALALLEESWAEVLFDLAATTPAAYSHAVALAIAKLPRDKALAALQRRAGQDANKAHKARYAILRLELGDIGLAQTLLRESPDPAARTTFIDEFRTWHGSLERLPEVLRVCQDPDCRSGLCAAVGGVDPADLGAQTREALTDELCRLYLQAEDGGTHAASEWALRRWNISLPVGATAHRADRRWFTNSLGMTLVRIPSGILPHADGLHVLRRPYYIGDREVTIAQFRTFLAEAGAAEDEKPAPWPGPHSGWGGDERIPIHNITRDHAFQFCNWLSRREGRRACYRRPDPEGNDWLCDPSSNGYRLPTAAEWDYANRCRTTTTFPFGEEPRWLTLYASVGLMSPVAGGSRLPNRWGLFDMVGNLWEACWSRSQPLIGSISATPGDGSDAGPEMARGGACTSGLFDCRSNYQVPAGWGESSLTFRVACQD